MKVDGVAAETRFTIQRGFRRDVLSDVGDMDLQEPTTALAALHIDRVVEIARGFAVDGDDRKAAKILASGQIGFRNGARQQFGFLGNFGGERVGQVMLADDDFGVHAEIAGAPENFDHAANGRGAFAGVSQEFGVNDGAIELGDVRKANALAGLLLRAGKQLFTQRGREFVARGKLDIVLDAGIVGDNHATARGVAEKAHYGGMRTGDDAKNASFGAARAGESAEAGNFGNHVVAVHGVFNVVARDEEVAVEIGDGDVRDDEAVAILVENKAAADFVAGDSFVLREFIGRRLGEREAGA